MGEGRVGELLEQPVENLPGFRGSALDPESTGQQA